MSNRSGTANPTLWGLLILFIVAALVLALLAVQWTQQRQAQEARSTRAQQRAYADYARSTAPPPEDKSAQQERQRQREQALQTRKTLLAHPLVTPGSGFDTAGVQSTGLAIIQAMDRAR